MNVSRRKFIQGAAAAGAAGLALQASGSLTNPPGEKLPQRKRRTIYFNDARHYYLFVFEPPMKLEDAWVPIDECAGTTVNTFAYGVARGDGLFYPSKIGRRFGEDIRPFNHCAYYRVWENMQSLIDRGLDPLTVLIDRAHAKGMEFFASLRIAGYGGMDPSHNVSNGGKGLAHEEVRQHQFDVLKELIMDYDTEGVELDFAASPGGAPPILREKDVNQYTPVITEWVRGVSAMARGRTGKPGLVGARVYPSEELCLRHGLDVPTWLQEGIVDYIVPMLYIDTNLDPDMPFDSLVEIAHANDVSVYGMLQPYTQNSAAGAPVRVYNTPEAIRAAAANFYAKDVDGVYTWFMKWPLGDAERRSLAEIGDPDLIKESNKLYVQRRRMEMAVKMGYDATLPIEIPMANPGKTYKIPFTIADDIAADARRIRQVRMELKIFNIVSADRLTVRLNGQPLDGETCLRTYSGNITPYQGQKLEFHLEKVRPRRGDNSVEISLDRRPKGFAGGISIEEMEVYVEYGVFPSGLNA